MACLGNIWLHKNTVNHIKLWQNQTPLDFRIFFRISISKYKRKTVLIYLKATYFWLSKCIKNNITWSCAPEMCCKFRRGQFLSDPYILNTSILANGIVFLVMSSHHPLMFFISRCQRCQFAIATTIACSLFIPSLCNEKKNPIEMPLQQLSLHNIQSWNFVKILTIYPQVMMTY